jgi:hypothetical protein
MPTDDPNRREGWKCEGHKKDTKILEHEGFPFRKTSGQLTHVSVGLEAGKPLRGGRDWKQKCETPQRGARDYPVRY